MAGVADRVPQILELAENNLAPGAVFLPPYDALFSRLQHESFGMSEILPPALYLCAACFSFVARLFQAWKLVHIGSQSTYSSFAT